MKKINRIILVLGILLMVVSSSMNAQETEVVEEATESESPFSVGADLVSSYVWRGVKYGGASLQPMVEFSASGFTLGAWGSFGLGPVDEAVNEADLYLSYGFDFGLSLGVSDYYYQGSSYFEYGDSISSHAFEINAGYEVGSFSIGANYILNDSRFGAGSQGGDMYFELGYEFDNFSLFLGAGDGWHTSTTEFEVCNIGISASKELKISDKFSLPVSGLVSINPQLETLNIVGTITF